MTVKPGMIYYAVKNLEISTFFMLFTINSVRPFYSRIKQNVAGSNPVSPTGTLGNTSFPRVFLYTVV